MPLKRFFPRKRIKGMFMRRPYALYVVSGVALILFCSSSLAYAQDKLTPPWSWPITSVFGPRTKDNGQRNIHKGIDYGRPSQAEPIEGKLIQAIEGGSITLIDDTVAGVYYMQITCSVPACHGRVFSYNHLFNNNILTGTLTPITGSNPNNYAK